ncbi:unnamed protein product [Lampetra fluviatilis]
MPLLVKLRPAPAAKAPAGVSLEVLWGRGSCHVRVRIVRRTERGKRVIPTLLMGLHVLGEKRQTSSCRTAARGLDPETPSKQQQRRRRQQQRQQQWQQRQQGQQQGQQRQQGQQQQGLLSPCRSDDATGAPAATPRVTAPGSARQVTPPPSPHCRLRAHPKDAVASCRDPNLQRPSSPRARGRVSSSSFHARRAEPMNLLHRDRHAHRLGTSIGVLAGPFASAINLVTKRLLMSASALVKSSMGRLFFVLLLLLLPKDNEAAATIISHGWNSCPDLPEYWGREGQGLGTSSVFSAFIFIRFSAEPRFCA